MEFKQHLKKYLTDEEINKLLTSLEEKDEHALLLNTNKMSKEDFKALFPKIKQHPLVDNGFYYDKDEYAFGKDFFHEMGLYYLQEPSAMIVSALLDPSPGDIVLDICAAPGGKSVQAALRMQNKGVIISNDLSRSRCNILLNNIERMGIANCLITNNDFSKIYQNYYSYFDKIILDAPCSGSGMFRKDEKMLDDWTMEKVLKNAAIQKELIDYAFCMLKEGGLMVYSTCSYSYEEDEEVVQYLLDKYENANIIQIDQNQYFYKSKNNIGVHLFPSHFKGEGHYICLISKGSYKKQKNEQILCKNSINSIKNGDLKKFGDTLFALPQPIKTKDLNIVRYGLNVSKLKGKDEIYSYHLAHCLHTYTHMRDLKECYVRAYTNGECLTINPPLENGMVLLTYKGIPFSFGKSVNGIIKNHFPSYLRSKKYNWS